MKHLEELTARLGPQETWTKNVHAYHKGWGAPSEVEARRREGKACYVIDVGNGIQQGTESLALFEAFVAQAKREGFEVVPHPRPDIERRDACVEQQRANRSSGRS